MADIKSIGGNPIVPESVAANSVTDAMLAQTGGVLSRVAGIDDFLYTQPPTNLFDADNVMAGVRTVSSGSKLQMSSNNISNYFTVRVPVEPSAAYSVVRSSSSYCIISESANLITNESFDVTNPIDVSYVDGVGSSTPTFFNFTTGASTNYIYICYTLTGEESTIAVYAGTYTSFQTVTTNVYTKAEVDALLVAHSGSAYRIGDRTFITNGKATYEVRHVTNADINVDCYRIYTCTLTESGQIVWSGSDADGVVKLVGEDDFLGGLHGDEITTSMSMLIDGVEVASGDFSEVEYDTITIYCESEIYHCNTSEQADTQAFTRYKVLTFDKDGVRVQNRWVAEESVNVNLCYFGLLSVLRFCADGTTPLINGYSTELGLELKGNTDTIALAENNNEVVMHTRYGDMSLTYLGPVGTTNKCSVENYTSPDHRLKAYMGTVNTGGVGVTLAQGDELCGDYVMRI